MLRDTLTQTLFDEMCRWPIVDTHSHIDPLNAASKSLDDLLGYHYYTELAHSAGVPEAMLLSDVDRLERCRTILANIGRFDNTVSYSWILEIARDFLGFTGDRLSADSCETLFDAASTKMDQSDWRQTVIRQTRLERIFLTNGFDDPLVGFDTSFFVPCLRTDDLVFRAQELRVRERIAKTTGIEVGDVPTLRSALCRIFERFKAAGARACAISLPPDFTPDRPTDSALTANAIFWSLAECCREFALPFDLMIGVVRNVYRAGVYQGQDLFDLRTSLMQYAELFNTFGDVTFPVSVLSSSQNQELVAFSWVFPNVLPHGHWWYSNVPAYIEPDLRARLTTVPKTKILGYYSDAYKLEFVLPKWNMYRRVLAQVLADEFIRTRRLSEAQALELRRTLLRTNAERVFSFA